MNDIEPDLDGIAERLRTERPIPRAGFRAELRSQLLASVGRQPSAPRRLRLLIAAYAGSGTALLAVVAVGVAGGGPFAS